MTKPNIQNITYDDFHTGLCLHESIIELYENGNEYWTNVIEGKGFDALRHQIITNLTDKFQLAYASIQDQYDDPFDFEFVPQMLKALKDPINDGYTDYYIAAGKVCAESERNNHLRLVQSTKEQGADDAVH